MKLFKKLVLGLICCSFSIASVVYAASDSTINYKNQRGSLLTLVFHSGEQENTGTLSGTFNTAVGDCATDVGVPLPISGYYNGNAATITVNFPHCNKVAAMTGNFSQKKNKLHTLWLVAKSVDDPRGNDWNSNIVGADSYKKI